MKLFLLYLILSITTLGVSENFNVEYKARSPINLDFNGGNYMLDFGVMPNKSTTPVVLNPTLDIKSSNFSKTIYFSSVTGGVGHFSQDSSGFIWSWNPDLGQGAAITGGLSGGHMNVKIKLPYLNTGDSYNNFNPGTHFFETLVIELSPQFSTNSVSRNFNEQFTLTITYNP